MAAQVSVIIPSYNRRAMVCEAIDSVLAQQGVVFELIAIDDGSTDGTAEHLRARYPELRIARTEHRGVAAARNHGVAVARAPLIAFLDSDDVWSPGKLQRQYDFMRLHPESEISQTAEIWIRDGKRMNPGRRHLKRPGDIFIDSLRTCLVSPSAVMMTAELFRAFDGFDEEMAACEDYDLWLRILLDHPIALLDEALVTRRAGHPDQLSAITPALDRFRIRTLLKLLKSQRLDTARTAAVAEVLCEKCRIYAQGVERRGNLAEASHFKTLAARAQRLVSDPAAVDCLGHWLAAMPPIGPSGRPGRERLS